MSTVEARRKSDGHVPSRTPHEYERLPGRARGWEAATGRLLRLAEAHGELTAAYASTLATAIAHDITTEPRAAAVVAQITRDAERLPDRSRLWPLLIGAWKRKPPYAPGGRSVPSGLALARKPAI